MCRKWAGSTMCIGKYENWMWLKGAHRIKVWFSWVMHLIHVKICIVDDSPILAYAYIIVVHIVIVTVFVCREWMRLDMRRKQIQDVVKCKAFYEMCDTLTHCLNTFLCVYIYIYIYITHLHSITWYLPSSSWLITNTTT